MRHGMIRGAVLAVLALCGAAPVVAQGQGALPPRRPASLGGAATAGPVRLAASDPADNTRPLVITPVAGPSTLSDKAIVDKANAALNAISTLSADFTQTGGDGRRTTGLLYLQRPGKLRFEYDAPSTMEVVSDGSTVLVRDRKLMTADPYPISQTPLKFLTSPRIDLGREVAVTDVGRDGEGVRVSIEDRTTLGGTSRITLGFDADVTTLTRWRIVDAQGLQTTVVLSNIDRNKKIDPKIFMLNFMRQVQ